MAGEVRRNFVVNPRAIGGNGWGFSAGTTGVAAQTFQASGGPTADFVSFNRVTWSTAQTTANGNIQTGAAAAGTYESKVTPGETIAPSIYLRSSHGITCRCQLNFYNAAGGLITSATGSTAVLSPNTWTRYSIPGTVVPALSARALLLGSQAGGILTVIGTTLDGAAPLIEKGSTIGSPFDGSTPDVSGMDYQWVGAANASESIAVSLSTSGNDDILSDLAKYGFSTGSMSDRIMAQLISMGYVTGSLADRERSRLLAKTGLTVGTLQDLYKTANERPRFSVGK